MRKIVLSLAAAGAALVFAAPAAAQYYPGSQQPGPGYGRGYGYGHGNWGEVRELRMRIDRIRQQIVRLDHRDAIANRAANRLMHEANEIGRRLNDRARGGLDPREAGAIRYRVQRLEQQVQWAREGRWDRFRDDRGRDRDRDRY
jgi:Spy/CpxP family protein refolding chaperone